MYVEKTHHLKSSMREEKLLPGWFIVKWGGVWDFCKACPERCSRLSVTGMKLHHSQQGAQHLTLRKTVGLWLAGGKPRTLAVTGCWNLPVLSPFPLRQHHHLKQNPKLRCIFSLAILSYTGPDWLEILVQFKMLFVHFDTLLSHVLLSRSSVTITSKTSYTELPTAHTPLGLTRCL